MQKHFRLNSSAILAALLLLVHGLTLAVLMLLPVPNWAKWMASAGLLGSLVYYLRRDAWLSLPASCVALRVEGEHIVLTSHGGNELNGQLLRDSVVSPAVVVLNVLPEGARFSRSVVIFPDAMDAEPFRELRVVLRWG